MEQTLPYITAALFCEKVIEGRDGVLSAIRIIDRAAVEFATTNPELLKVLTDAQQKQQIIQSLPITGLICIKAGSLVGKFNIHVDGVKPSGMRSRLHTFPVELNGGDTGANFILNLMIGLAETGTHWFEVLCNDHILTRIPLTILRGPAQDAPGNAVSPVTV